MKSTQKFILRKACETIIRNIIAFVLVPNLKDKTIGELRVSKHIQNKYGLSNDNVYEIFLKLNLDIGAKTRLIVCRIHDKK